MSQNLNRVSITAILTLCFVILIDSIGLGLLFPLMNPIFMSAQGILPLGTCVFTRDFYYGLTLALFTVGMFVASPILGDLSDQIGRKKVLVFILAGTVVTYAFSGVALTIKSITLLLVTRFIAGFAAGSQTIAQAAVIDISPAHKKTTYLSLVLFFISFGFILGPLIGGFLSDHNIVSWFNLSMPLYFSAFLSLLNLILLCMYFRETRPQTQKLRISWSKSITLFMDAFTTVEIRRLSTIYFLAMLAWSFYYQYIAVLLTHHYHYNNNQVGVFLSVMAVGFGSTFLILIPFFVKYFKTQQINFVGLSLMLLGLIFTAFIPWLGLAWVGSLCVALGNASYYTTTASLCSDQVGHDRQGWVMGVLTSVSALCWTVTALASSVILAFGSFGPFVVAAICAAAALGLLIHLQAAHKRL